MSSFSHTPAQEEAISTLDRNLLVLASAGTGKTYVLVRRFLYILEHKEDWSVSSVVALTFTKLAAQEMRVRILREVNERKQVSAEGSIWHERSGEMAQLQVSTVHSFCERVLRQHAVEADIDPDFSVLADDDVELLRKQAINMTFAEMAETEAEWLEAMPRYTRQDLQHTLNHAFTKRSTLHYVLSQKCIAVDSLLADWQQLVLEEMDLVWQQYEKTHPDLKESMCRLGDFIGPGRQRGWDAEDKLGQQMAPSYHAVQAIRSRDWTAAVETLEEESMARKQSGAKTKWHNEEALLSARQHMVNVRDALVFLRKQEFSSRADPHAAEAAQAVRTWLELWQKALDHYSGLKQERLGLDYDDLEILALEILQKGRAEPGSRVGRFVSAIRQVLADEHQDINPVQQQIIDTLAPIESPGRLFVVGDTKQSIYRFRQAQVTAFAELAVKLRKETDFEETTLASSFRTQQPLVAATNHLFNHVLTPVMGEEFASFEAKPLPLTSNIRPLHNQLASVELHIVQKLDSESTGVELKQDEIRLIANRLIQLKANGLSIRTFNQTGTNESGERPSAFRWKDAAILLRSSGDVGLFENVLRTARIPYQVAAEVPLQSRLPIRALLALLRHLHRPLDDFNLAVALRSPLFGIDDGALYRLMTRLRAADMPLCLFSEIEVLVGREQAARLEQAAQILQNLYPWTHSVSPEQLLRRILEYTGLLETCMADADRYRGARHLEEIRAFQAHLRDEQHRPLGELLRRCTELGISYQHAEEAETADGEGRVRIMTIHKSKGLEFPVVFVPQLDRRLSGSGNSMENPMLVFDPEFGFVCQLRDEQGATLKPRSHWAAMRREDRMRYVETKRMLYVACTRAADLLIMTGVHAKKEPIGPSKRTDQGQAPHWLSEVLEAYDLNSELFEVGQPCTIKRSDGNTSFRLRSAGYQAGTLALEEQKETIATIVPGTEDIGGPTALSLPLETKAEDLQEIGRDTRQQRIGTFTHDLITQWNSWYPKSRIELQELVTARLRQAEIADPLAESDVLAYLSALRASPLAKAINAAPVKHWEVPVALREYTYVKHRRIDLLYQSEDGLWHIVDWKTERVTEVTLPDIKRSYMGILATYAQAVEKLLGQYPEVCLCFLSPEIRVVPVSRQELVSVRPT